MNTHLARLGSNIRVKHAFCEFKRSPQIFGFGSWKWEKKQKPWLVHTGKLPLEQVLVGTTAAQREVNHYESQSFKLFLYLLPCKRINSSTSAQNQHFLFQLLLFKPR